MVDDARSTAGTQRDLPKGTSVRFTYHKDDAPHLTRAKHRREYYHVLDCVDAQTGAPGEDNDQQAMIPLTSIHQQISRNGVNEPKNRVNACLQQGDLVKWRDSERGALVCLARLDAIQAAIAEENVSDEPNREKIEHLAAAAREVRRDD